MRHATLPHFAHGLHPSRSIPIRLGGVETIHRNRWYKTYGVHVCSETSNTVLSLVLELCVVLPCCGAFSYDCMSAAVQPYA